MSITMIGMKIIPFSLGVLSFFAKKPVILSSSTESGSMKTAVLMFLNNSKLRFFSK